MSNASIFKSRTKKVSGAVQSGIDKALSEFVKTVPAQIKARTRVGGGLDSDDAGKLDGRRKQLDKLKNSTKDYRSTYKKNLSGQTTPSKSNLTATGQMLDSLRGRKRPGNKIRVSPTGNRTRELDGSSSGLSNIEVQKRVERNGRTFLGLTTAETNKFRRIARNIIKKKLAKAFN